MPGSGVMCHRRTLILVAGMTTVKDIKYLYSDSKYKIECLDIISSLTVANTDYETIVSAIQDKLRDAENVRVLSFTR